MSIQAIIITVCISVALIVMATWMRYRWFIYSGNRRRDIPVTPCRFFASLYSLLLFIIMVYGIALPLTIALFLTVWNKDRRLYIYHVFLRWSSQLILKMLPGINFTFENSIGETFNKPSVIISNHQGHFDLMCIMMMTPRLVVLTNRWVWRNPLYGWIIHLAEFYPVTNGLDYNIPRLKNLIERGYSIVIFPEGTRSADCRILRFHTGAFYLAGKLGVDILPVILHGVGHCIPKEDFMLRPGHMYLEVMKRIKVEPDGSEMYMRNLSKQIRSMYTCRYNELKKSHETSAYFTRYIENKYKYITAGAYRRTKHLLKVNNNYSSTVDIDFEPNTTILVHDESQGVLSWLIILVHTDVKVISVICNKKELKIALTTPAIPYDRLEFVSNYYDSEVDYTITMSQDGLVNNIKKSKK